MIPQNVNVVMDKSRLETLFKRQKNFDQFRKVAKYPFLETTWRITSIPSASTKAAQPVEGT